ncbi:MAG TPA: hypothetical protein VFG52_08925 [Xanthomonadales bacterium]|nr:hypothetical protein [Xanthomonadales bacterium]
MKRGIISIIWGNSANLPLDRLLASTRKHHPELPHQIIEVSTELTGSHAFQEKSRMLDHSPFEETLYLDADTIVLGKLNFGFEQAIAYGLAMTLCENPWARRYPKIFAGDEVEYNTGVVFFTRQHAALFEAWKQNARELDSELVFVKAGVPVSMASNDQGTFAAAVRNLGINPFILPANWNFRPKWQKSFFGPLKIWHDYSDPPDAIHRINDYYSGSNSIIQYHRL